MEKMSKDTLIHPWKIEEPFLEIAVLFPFEDLSFLPLTNFFDLMKLEILSMPFCSQQHVNFLLGHRTKLR